jgi:hypothetical protein
MGSCPPRSDYGFTQQGGVQIGPGRKQREDHCELSRPRTTTVGL